MVMYANEVETKEKEKSPEIKNQLQHTHSLSKLTLKQIKAWV